MSDPQKPVADVTAIAFVPWEQGQRGVIYDWPDGSFSGHAAGDAEGARAVHLIRRIRRHAAA